MEPGPELAHYLQKNVAPSEPGEPSIKRLKTREDLLLPQSFRQQQQEEQVIEPYKTIMAPVFRIPSDVLLEIFHLCLPTHRNPIMDSKEAPILLTHICSNWRSEALSSPRIWSRLHIHYPPPRQERYRCFTTCFIGDPERLVSKPTPDDNRPTISRSKMIKTWLDRSGEYPLFMTIVCHQRLEEPTPGTVSTAILDAFIPYTRRWRTLELIVTSEFYATLNKYVSVDMLPMLETLRLVVTHDHVANHEDESAPFHGVFLRAPKLKKLSLDSSDATSKFRNIPPLWNQLTYLFLHSGIRGENLYGLLSQCLHLTTCRLEVWLTGQPVDIPTRPIRLPFLHTFIVYELVMAGTNDMVMSAACRVIRAPVLRRLAYTKSLIGMPVRLEVEQPVLYLLDMSPVEELTLDICNIPDDLTFSDILRAAHHTKHLVLGRKYPNSLQPYRPSQGFEPVKYNLNLLRVHITPGSLLNDILLPNLEILEAYDICSFSDDDLLKMVKSRLDTAKLGLTPALKLVKLHFTRDQDRDIIPEIYSYARDIGLNCGDLEIKLNYFKDTLPGHKDPLSSLYGLIEDGRSWRPDGPDDEVVYY